MQKNKLRNLTLLLIFLIMLISQVNQAQYSEIVKKDVESSATQLIFANTGYDHWSIIRTEYLRGNQFAKTSVSSVYDTDFSGTVTFRPNYLYTTDHVEMIYAHNGSEADSSNVAGIFDNYQTFTGVADTSYQCLTVSGDLYHRINSTNNRMNVYFRNNTNDVRFFYPETDEITLSVDYSTYNSAGSLSDTANSANDRIKLEYYLQPQISINSTYYNFENIRAEVKSPVITSYDKSLEGTDGWYWDWFEQDLRDLTLSFCYYRLRIYDKETSDLIYEDTNDVLFTTYRTITINSLKIANNAGEPVNASLYSAERQLLSSNVTEQEYEINSVQKTPETVTVNSGTKNSSDYSVLESNNAECLKLTPEYINKTIDDGDYQWAAGVEKFKDTYPCAPENWTEYNSIGSIDIVEEQDGHYYPAYFDADSDSAYYNTEFEFSSAVSEGSIEFWLNLGNCRWFLMYLNKSSSPNKRGTLITFTDGDIQYHEGGSWTMLTTFTENQWIHIRITFDCATDTQDLYINQVLELDDSNFIDGDATNFTGFCIRGRYKRDNAYIDAIGCSWDDYTTYNNIYKQSYIANTTMQFDASDLDYNRLYNFNLNYSYYSNISTSIETSIYNDYSSESEEISSNSSTTLIELEHAEDRYESLYFTESMLFNISIYAENESNFEIIFDKILLNVSDFIVISSETYNVTYYSPHVYSTIVNPYSYVITNISDSLYNFSYVYVQDLYSNDLENDTLANQTSYSYTPANVISCFISIADQENNYLEFSNYKVYINNSIIYSPQFYREIGDNVSIEIKDRYGISVKNVSHTVSRDENWINAQINLYSLKICNYLEQFHHINVSRDPIYHDSEQFWSEYIGPHEIINFDLAQGYYKIEVEWNNGSTVDYSYTLNGDDVLLLSSSNTLANVISNINNVNTTLGNQITNVEINITNTQSQINSSIVNVDINLSNVNSTLGNLLLSQNTTINAIGNNITTLYVYCQNQFTALGNNINTSFASLNSSIYLVNNSIYTAINSLEAELTSINNTISGNLTLILTQNEYLTHIYQYSMFSDFLDWDNATQFSVDYLNDSIDYYTFINEYRNKSVELMLRYNAEIETLQMNALDKLNRYLPSSNVEYRVYSLEDEEYLDEWEDLNETTVDIGFYSENVPETPDVIDLTANDWFYFGLAALIVIAIIEVLYFKAKRSGWEPKARKRKSNRKIRDERGLY
ncbi:MAG: hypothetical protein GF353_28610 [Candidatus Lokiarchaeota archaeon]|nr:hypothetical protein [Candidatus Lokiarchaeota archaeon]MBD3353965.1 hypothetical protein [Candidatus Lokiarchaeota archaeon]